MIEIRLYHKRNVTLFINTDIKTFFLVKECLVQIRI